MYDNTNFQHKQVVSIFNLFLKVFSFQQCFVCCLFSSCGCLALLLIALLRECIIYLQQFNAPFTVHKLQGLFIVQICHLE